MQSDGSINKSIGLGKDVTGCTEIMRTVYVKERREMEWRGGGNPKLSSSLINSIPAGPNFSFFFSFWLCLQWTFGKKEKKIASLEVKISALNKTRETTNLLKLSQSKQKENVVVEIIGKEAR